MSIQDALAIADRFWARVQRCGPDECWPWLGYCKPTGYGYWSPSYRGRNWQAHRLAFLLTHGYEATNETCHTCDNHRCCNPKHLYDGTHQQNMRDAVERGRRCRGESNKLSKLTEEIVRTIRNKHGLYGSGRQLATQYGVTPRTIQDVASRKTWKHVG